jgi:hypothetical protein
LLEVGEFFGGEDEGFGVDAGFEGVHGEDGLACGRGGAGGLFGITAAGFYLTDGRRGWLASELRSEGQVDPEGTPACPTLKIEERLRGFGGECL